jgi:hypothetical protein
MASKYILVDKVYLEEMNSYKLFLYDHLQGIIVKAIVPISKTINLTQLEDVESALQDIE